MELCGKETKIYSVSACEPWEADREMREEERKEGRKEGRKEERLYSGCKNKCIN